MAQFPLEMTIRHAETRLLHLLVRFSQMGMRFFRLPERFWQTGIPHFQTGKWFWQMEKWFSHVGKRFWQTGKWVSHMETLHYQAGIGSLWKLLDAGADKPLQVSVAEGFACSLELRIVDDCAVTRGQLIEVAVLREEESRTLGLKVQIEVLLVDDIVPKGGCSI